MRELYHLTLNVVLDLIVPLVRVVYWNVVLRIRVGDRDGRQIWIEDMATGMVCG